MKSFLRNQDLIKFNSKIFTTTILCTNILKMSGGNNFRIRSEKSLKHLFDGSELNVYEINVINLGVGAPGPDLLSKCCDLFQKATDHQLKKTFSENAMLFQYGPTCGTLEIRSELANYLSDIYKNHVYKEDIVITTGATHGLHLILSTMIDMNGVVIVDEVTYFIALRIFQQFPNMSIVPVKLKKNGVDIEHLDTICDQYKCKSTNKLFWGLYYTIPTFHNPTGITFSNEVCASLIKIARKHDILVACDDVYNILCFNDDAHPKRLYEYDCIEDNDYKGNVISNGSFSKIVGPGVRLGWMEAPPRCKTLLDESGILTSGGCTNNYTSGLFASMFQLNIAQSHIEMMRHSYRERMIAVCDILKCHLPSSCDFQYPDGGYFIWIRLPLKTNGNQLLDYCLKNYKISFIVGSRFSINQTFENCIRISIAFHSKEILSNAAKNLCTAIDNFLKI